MKKICRKTGKIKYRSHTHALLRAGKILDQNAKAEFNKKLPTKMAAYHCIFGDHWHLTSWA